MTRPDVLVVRTGLANTASVLAALERAGARADLSDDAARVAAAERVVLPGVGAFGAGMAWLRERELDGALRERVEAGSATLAVCLGLQLLCASSAEDPGVPGVGALPVAVERLAPAARRAAGGGTPAASAPALPRVPHIGWSPVAVDPGAVLLAPGWAFFAHSYCVRSAPDGWCAARSPYAGGFVAALERGGVLACQFHPELSSRWGGALVARWVAEAVA